MLKAAMAELRIGDPGQLATDVGPVIDQAAQAGLLAHIEQARAQGRVVFQLPLPAVCEHGHFVPPTLIEIDALSDLHGEVFGPVVHVLRFAGHELERLIDEINASGYGLTLGVHSRIDETVEQVCRHATVGNIYVNRNMVGAVVGVQPFGGERLSGTGPKAGGPLYLQRLAGCQQLAPADLGCPLAEKAVPLLERLGAWAVAAGEAGLASLCRDYGRLSLLHARLELPGPTGERNILHFAPRGLLLCLADSEAALPGQIAAALATGNRIALVDSLAARQLLERLPRAIAALVEFRQRHDYQGIAGVLFVGTHATAIDLCPRLASEPGPLIPLIAVDERQRYPLYRLLLERVVSVNSAAAGGNTSLMTLEP
jgi:RHH-type proline utilization regulon transcriptional repressor/proline dehydrogenase/delta 1-pyrroline-5-carboxylate dehydrogenase